MEIIEMHEVTIEGNAAEIAKVNDEGDEMWVWMPGCVVISDEWAAELIATK